MRKGSSASSVTIQGEIVVKQFFPVNGPSGTYSHAWTSLIDQSFSKTIPKIDFSASYIFILLPSSLTGLPIKKPISNSKSIFFEGANLGFGS